MFGKDRATGGSAQDTVRANTLNDFASPDASLDRVNETPFGADDHFDRVRANNHGTSDDLTVSVYSNAVDSQRNQRAPKKRKRGDLIDGLIDVIGQLHEDTNARLDRLSAHIGYEFDLTKARKEVFEMMGAIPGLTLSQVFIASDAILSRVGSLDYFMSLPEGARQAYV